MLLLTWIAEGVIAELEVLGRTVQEAFGVIGQRVDDFESLFQDEDLRRNPIRDDTSPSLL